MGSEIRRDHVFGNFRTRKPKEKKARKADSRPGMSEKHCALIRKLPCCACGRIPAGTIHHLKSGTGERGVGLRSTDKWGTPLCLAHHEEIERAGTRNEVSTFGKWGIDPHDLAIALWAATGDLPKMTKIVIAHRTSRGSQ